MAFVTLIARAAMFVGISNFLTGLIICNKIRNNGSTGDVSSFPFAAGVLCTFLWLKYGLYVEDMTMVTVNFIGVLLQSAYLSFYFIMSKNKRPVIKQIIGLGVTLSVLMTFVVSQEDYKHWAGLLACLSNFIFIGSPLASLRDVIRTKSTANMPFHFILFSFVSSTLWTTYGLLIDDQFLIVPNSIGASLAGIQLALFAIYPATPTSKYGKVGNIDKEQRISLINDADII